MDALITSAKDALNALKRGADLLALAERDTTLTRTGAGWYAGPCPFCGGRDRFVLKQTPEGWRWLCRKCSGDKYLDAVDYVMRRDNVSLREAVARMSGYSLAKVPQLVQQSHDVMAFAPDVVPDEAWQVSASLFVDECAQRLWRDEGAKALEYLHRRGLKDETIERAMLGFWPGGEVEPFGFVARAITIPVFDGHHLYGVKLRHADGKAKYTSLKGSKARLYQPFGVYPGAELLLTEGEFDCLVAGQALMDVLNVATLGGCTARPTTRDRLDIGLASRLLVAYDNDEAGRDGAKRLAEFLSASVVAVPQGHKDINEAYLAGVDLYAWIAPHLEPVDAQSMAEMALSLGAVLRAEQ